MRRVTHGLILGAVLASVGLGSAGAQTPAEVQEIIAEAAERHGVSAPWLLRVAACETGNTWNPRAVGDGGMSLGVFQLHRQGLLPSFYRQGFSDPFNVWEAAEFAAASFARGLSSHWTCARR